MNKLKVFLFIFLINIFFGSFNALAISWKMNFSISPIKQRIDINPWENTIKTAKITNRGETTVTMKISVSDLTADNLTGSPILLTRHSEEVFDQTLAPWINLQTTSVTLAPKQEKEIAFAINVPSNATPWGHYWAIIFQDNNSSSSSWNSTVVNVHYWSVILLKVAWEVVIDWEIKEVKINEWLWISKGLDDCPMWDFTKSNYDNKCIDVEIVDNFINKKENIEKNSNEIKENNKKIEELKKQLDEVKQEKENIKKEFEEYKKSGGKTKTIEEFEREIKKKQKNIEKELDKISKDINNKNKENISKDFWVKFEIPIINKGNSHLHPEWKIVLKDEDWKVIKRIWKKVIINKKWLVIWNEIVDYLPINNSDWDVFPKKERILQIEWKWFPYEVINEKWEREIKFFSPSEYYTKKSMWWDRIMMPWERVCSRLNKKTITAYTDVSYLDENGKKVTTTKENKFKISYIEEYIWYDYYKLLFAWITFFIILLLFLLLLLNKKKCINKDCKKKLKKDMDVCPYCWIVQNWKNKWKKAKFKK